MMLRRRHKKVSDEIVEEIETVTESPEETVDITELTWNDLRAFAAEKGMNIQGKKRVDIEAELVELGGENDTGDTE